MKAGVRMTRRALRFVLAAVVSSGLLAVVAPEGRAASAGSKGATLLVNDTDAVGMVGDNKLSLDEAIRLANGSLRQSQLSQAERQQVRGMPGPGAPDLIKVVL